MLNKLIALDKRRADIANYIYTHLDGTQNVRSRWNISVDQANSIVDDNHAVFRRARLGIEEDTTYTTADETGTGMVYADIGEGMVGSQQISRTNIAAQIYSAELQALANMSLRRNSEPVTQLLCVGGVIDGQMAGANDRGNIWTAVQPPNRNMPAMRNRHTDISTAPVAINSTVYVRERICHGESIFYYWRDVSLSPSETIERLFRYYRPNAE